MTTAELPFREAPRYEQWVAVISGFVIKPTYMLLSLVLVAVLWRSKSSDLAALRWAMIFFFLGEAFCAANYFMNNDSLFADFLHSYGMVLSFAFTTFAAAQAMDHRFFKYTNPKDRCAAIELCRSCTKYTSVPCGLKRSFLLFLPMLIIVALMPFTAALNTISYDTRILGTCYNYSHPIAHQLYEIRFAPAAAIVLLIIAIPFLAFAKNDSMLKSKVLFAAAVGSLGFGFFRWILLACYHDNLVWFECWEEISELLFIVGTLAILWLFRHGLFPPRSSQSSRIT